MTVILLVANIASRRAHAGPLSGLCRCKLSLACLLKVNRNQLLYSFRWQRLQLQSMFSGTTNWRQCKPSRISSLLPFRQRHLLSHENEGVTYKLHDKTVTTNRSTQCCAAVRFWRTAYRARYFRGIRGITVHRGRQYFVAESGVILLVSTRAFPNLCSKQKSIFCQKVANFSWIRSQHRLYPCVFSLRLDY